MRSAVRRAKGIYLYASGGKKGDDTLPPLNPESLPKQPIYGEGQQDDNTLRDRMVLVMVNEAARVLEDGVVEAPEDVDFGMIMGTGWAPFRGGPLRYADARGLPEVVRRLDELASRAGEHFRPCQLLRSLATKGRNFYSPRETGSKSAPISEPVLSVA